jgi:hypothetical protein
MDNNNEMSFQTWFSTGHQKLINCSRILPQKLNYFYHLYGTNFLKFYYKLPIKQKFLKNIIFGYF